MALGHAPGAFATVTVAGRFLVANAELLELPDAGAW